ncbi:MAG: hypothetical protein IJN05_11600 [Ruminococcus sp.]|nr:hypothetical protein [Ruminococcus sp.]
MKNFKKTILTAAMLVSAFNLIPAKIMHISAVDFKMPADKGDVNNDTLVDAIDASLVLADYALVSTGKESSFDEKQSYSADINEDNKIDAIDASLILAHYAFIATGGENNDTPTVTTTTTSVTTTAPLTTTTAQTTTTQSSSDYKLEDIATNVGAFYHFSNCLRQDLLKNNGFYMDYGITYGGYEVDMILTILNDGKISEDVIKKVFKDYSVEEIKNSIKFLYSIHEIEKYYGTRIDYSKYTLNKEIGNYINKISYHKYNGGYEDFMYDTFMLGVDANIVINNTPVAAFMATYDSENKYMGKENANEMGVDEFVNNVTQIALGKSYTR